MEAALALLARAAIRQRRPDVAYVRIAASTSLVAEAITRAGVPLVLELNGRILAELETRGRGAVARGLVRRNLRRAVSRAAILIAPAAQVARHATEALGAERTAVVENGADLDVARPGDRREARRRLRLPFDGRYVGFVGSLVEEQRLDLLIAAVSGMEGVTLLVAGDGARRPLVQRAAAVGRAVVYFGRLPHGAAIDVVRASDVCADVREGDFGMKGREYAVVGRRVVAFREAGVERLVSVFGGDGFVVVVDDRSAAGLGRGISEALRLEETRGPVPPATIARVRSMLGWDRTADALAEILERVIAF